VINAASHNGFFQELFFFFFFFFYVVGVDEISAHTLKKEICNVLARHNLQVENIQGQGYDGASNMRCME
jgi:hypothetical protein